MIGVEVPYSLIIWNESVFMDKIDIRLKKPVIEWLNCFVGPHFSNNIDPENINWWRWQWTLNVNRSMMPRTEILFGKESSAVLFKLTWIGS